MTSNTTVKKWTDTEKLALLISVINDTNANPDWATLNLPQGRTLRASQAIFGQLKKEAAAHPMAAGAAIPPTKKRGRKPADESEGDATASSKKPRGGRKSKKAAAFELAEDGEEENVKKKVKVETEDEGEEDRDGEE